MCNPILTVITVCLNDKISLQKTISSIFSQDIFKKHKCAIEYWIIDGGSEDGTIEVLNKYQKEHPNLFKYLSENDSGIYDAMNKGLEKARGKYIQFLNAGDIYTNASVLSYMYKILYERNDDAIYGDCIKHYNDVYERYAINPQKHMFICHQSIFFLKETHLVYRYELKYKFLSDYNNIIKMYLDKRSFFHISFPIVKYDMSGVSSVRYADEATKEGWRIRREKGIESGMKNYLKYLYEYYMLKIYKNLPEQLRWRAAKLYRNIFQSNK